MNTTTTLTEQLHHRAPGASTASTRHLNRRHKKMKQMEQPPSSRSSPPEAKTRFGGAATHQPRRPRGSSPPLSPAQRPQGSTCPPAWQGSGGAVRPLSRARPQGSARGSSGENGAGPSPPARPAPPPHSRPTPAPPGAFGTAGAPGARGRRLPRIGGDPPGTLLRPRDGASAGAGSAAGTRRSAAGLRGDAGSGAGSRGGASPGGGASPCGGNGARPPPWRSWTWSRRCWWCRERTRPPSSCASRGAPRRRWCVRPCSAAEVGAGPGSGRAGRSGPES